MTFYVLSNRYSSRQYGDRKRLEAVLLVPSEFDARRTLHRFREANPDLKFWIEDAFERRLV